MVFYLVILKTQRPNELINNFILGIASLPQILIFFATQCRRLS